MTVDTVAWIASMTKVLPATVVCNCGSSLTVRLAAGGRAPVQARGG
jgi:hypothetical protein